MTTQAAEKPKETPVEQQKVDETIAEAHKNLTAEAEKQAAANADAAAKQQAETAEFQKKMDAHQAKTQARR